VPESAVFSTQPITRPVWSLTVPDTSYLEIKSVKFLPNPRDWVCPGAAAQWFANGCSCQALSKRALNSARLVPRRSLGDPLARNTQLGRDRQFKRIASQEPRRKEPYLVLNLSRLGVDSGDYFIWAVMIQ
jgi:hypothetical protein